jgi:hypothetical protein
MPYMAWIFFTEDFVLVYVSDESPLITTIPSDRTLSS